MAQVKVKTFIGISTPDNPNKEKLDIQRDVKNGITIRYFLNQLANEYGPSFQEEIYNPQKGALSNIIMIILNGTSLDLPSGLETKLQDGDLLVIAPILQGG